MPVKLNARALSYAKGRISRGKIDYDGEWSFSDEERNALFADGIDRFAEWHLGKDTAEDEGTINAYGYAYGKDGRVSRAALEAVVREARRAKKKDPACADIEKAAKELRDLIDVKRENGRRCLFVGPREGMENESDPRKRYEGVILCNTAIPLELGDRPDMVDGGGRTGWTQIAMTGKWLGHWQGAFEVTEDDLSVMVENFHRFTNALLFDYGHESVFNSAALASGWGHEMEIGKGGSALYTDTEWTEKAAGHITAGELKYISPVIMFSTIDPYTAEDIGPSIWTVALLNTPFLDGMDPVEIGGKIAATRKLLNGAPPNRQWIVPASAIPTEDTNDVPAEPAAPNPAPEPVINSNPTGQEPAEPLEDDTMSLKDIALSLGLPETATADEIKQAIKAKDEKTAQSQADAQALADVRREADEAKALAARLEQEKQERELKDAQDLVEGYIKAGRIAPASREQAVQLALQDRASFDGLYGAPDKPGAPAVPLGQVAPPAEPPGADSTPVSLTEEEMTVCKSMHLTPERFAAEKARREKKGVLNGRADLPDDPSNITVE